MLFPSESAQKTRAALLVRIVAVAELITLLLDFKISSFAKPETVMFAPTDRSPVDEVAVIATAGAVIEPLVAIEPHSTVTELAERVPAEVFANWPVLQVAEKVPIAETAPETDRPPAELLRDTVPPVMSGPPTVPKPEELRVKFRATDRVPEEVATVEPVLVSEIS